jgi:hypothetical protein
MYSRNLGSANPSLRWKLATPIWSCRVLQLATPLRATGQPANAALVGDVVVTMGGRCWMPEARAPRANRSLCAIVGCPSARARRARIRTR